MRISQLRVNNVEHPLGFQVDPLSFSWKVEEAGNSKKMQSARIQIFREEELIYDSGEDENANSTDYQVKMELQPRTRYTWSVEVKADVGEVDMSAAMRRPPTARLRRCCLFAPSGTAGPPATCGIS